MGKAGKWILNLFVAKKEDKCKKGNVASVNEESMATSISDVPATPSYKRKWSFGKSGSKGRSHRSAQSFDSVTITQVISEPASLALQNQRKSTDAIESIVKQTKVEHTVGKSVHEEAAIRIQAAFRSYLAKKALGALRGIVKIQALVRGHLIRKQTAATLRGMHALMAIQVRARCQRIQMTRGESQFKEANKDAIDPKLPETFRVSTKRRECVDHLQKETGSIINNFIYDMSPTSSTNPRTITGRASFTYQKPDYVHPFPNQYPFLPNYMANTESFRAKARSQSEPKQRPKLSTGCKPKILTSMDGTKHQQNDPAQANHENQQYPWLIKLYQSTPTKDHDSDAKSTTSNEQCMQSKFLAD